tara:strand:- start:460 stop:645 length:186 start_codon:yes stop_codon:yes gene_type:complete
MFEHIDDIVEKIVKKYPEFEQNLDRTLIHNAVQDTKKLDRLIQEAKRQSEKNQRNLFDDNN